MKEEQVGPYIVTTDDGRMFHCSLSNSEAEDRRRWVLRDSEGVRYIGPSVTEEKSATAVRRLVNEWWNQTQSSSRT